MPLITSQTLPVPAAHISLPSWMMMLCTMVVWKVRAAFRLFIRPSHLRRWGSKDYRSESDIHDVTCLRLLSEASSGFLTTWVCSFICSISYLRQWGSTRYGSISWHIWCHTSPLTFWGFVPISFSLSHWCICNHIGAWTVIRFYFSVAVNKRRF